MTTHRPLSAWIAPVDWSVEGTARLASPVEVNYGDERADARALADFDVGWRRQAVAMETGLSALGLVQEVSGRAVVELDNRARPVRASEAAVQVISRVEDSWPEAGLPAADLAVLAGEDTVVRYLLVDRLAAEGDPPPELFHVLPWARVDALAGQVLDLLNGGAAAPAVIELGPWFTPAGSRFSAALEQLDEGLRRQEPALARVAATALCSRLLAVQPARLPAPTRRALARLAEGLGQADPLLAFTVRRVIARMTQGDDASLVTPLRLGGTLAAAADDAAGVRTQSLDAARAPFTVRLVVTATGRAEVVVSALLDDLPPAATRPYGVVLVPVRVAGAAGGLRYLIPLGQAGGVLSGRLDVAVPAGPFVEADLDGPPIGAAELAVQSEDEVRRSIRGLRTRSGRALWTRLAELLPPAHPLRDVIDEEQGD